MADHGAVCVLRVPLLPSGHRGPVVRRTPRGLAVPCTLLVVRSTAVTPTEINALAQKMVERFPARAGSFDQQADDDSRTRQVIVEELGAYCAQQPVKLRDMVRVHVCRVLSTVGWNRTAAAIALGVSTKTVMNMIDRWRRAGHEIPNWNGSYRG